jgi:4a-hydroxytetrahydrobiopterin dehydratase
MALTAKTCLPCRGGIPPLSYAQAVPYLEEVPDWELTGTGDRIERRFKFADFATALDFVNRVGGLAEREGHHPDVSFGWGYASIVLYTHKIKGLHENYFIMAAKIDALS